MTPDRPSRVAFFPVESAFFPALQPLLRVVAWPAPPACPLSPLIGHATRLGTLFSFSIHDDVLDNTDSGHHGASPAQVRGKTEPPHHPLSFSPNSKPSRALNRRQSKLQEAPVRQPYPPTMKISRGINLVRPQLLYFGSNNRELLEVDFFLPPYIYLGRWQITSFGKKY